VVIHLEKRSTLLLNKLNSIKLTVVPAAGSSDAPVGPFAIQAIDQTGPDVESSEILEDIDAFAVNVTKIEARGGFALATELLVDAKTLVALNRDSAGPQLSEGGSVKTPATPASHSFRAHARMMLLPFEVRGNQSMAGAVGWVRISIS
jgi:hypothetical protein